MIIYKSKAKEKRGIYYDNRKQNRNPKLLTK